MPFRVQLSQPYRASRVSNCALGLRHHVLLLRGGKRLGLEQRNHRINPLASRAVHAIMFW